MRLQSGRITLAAILVALLATLALGSRAAAEPGTDTGNKGEAPADSYALRGDAINPIGEATTGFRTNSGSTSGGWVFADTATDATTLFASCNNGNFCRGVRAVGRLAGISGTATNLGGSEQSYGVMGATTSSGIFAAGVYGVSNNGGDSNSAPGVFGEAFGRFATGIAARVAGSSARGMVSTALGATGVGVSGEASGVSGIGVQGLVNGRNAQAVFGRARGELGIALNGEATGAQGIAVKGVSPFVALAGQTSNGITVRGIATGIAPTSYGGIFTATAGTGLAGISTGGFGVYGFSLNNYGLAGGSKSNIGIRATSDSGIGLFANSESRYGALIHTKTGHAAIRATVVDNAPGRFALIADGNVHVNGNIICTGCTQATALKTDKGERLVYADSSTQSIVSDRGTAQVEDGRATITIDPLFAQTVALDAGYQVFLTPGSSKTAGLAVERKSATQFEVVELAGGKHTFSFDWRIEAPRKGHDKERLAPAPVVPKDEAIDDGRWTMDDGRWTVADRR